MRPIISYGVRDKTGVERWQVTVLELRDGLVGILLEGPKRIYIPPIAGMEKYPLPKYLAEKLPLLETEVVA